MSVNTSRVISIITGVIFIFIVVKIVKFIESMPQCACSVPTQTLDRIAFLEKIVIGIACLGIVYNLYFLNKPDDTLMMKIFSNDTLFFIPQMAYFVIIFFVYAVFIYNVNDFRKSISKKCECADKWEKTAMYIQAIFYIITLSLLLISVILLLQAGVFKMATPEGKILTVLGFSIIAVFAFAIFGGDMNVFLDHTMKYVDKEEGFSSDGSCGCDRDKNKWLLA
jgi:hypothetical protein